MKSIIWLILILIVTIVVLSRGLPYIELAVKSAEIESVQANAKLAAAQSLFRPTDITIPNGIQYRQDIPWGDRLTMIVVNEGQRLQVIPEKGEPVVLVGGKTRANVDIENEEDLKYVYLVPLDGEDVRVKLRWSKAQPR